MVEDFPGYISALVDNSKRTQNNLENALEESDNIRQEAKKIEELLEEMEEDNEKLHRLVRGIAGDHDETYQEDQEGIPEEVPTDGTRERVANLLKGLTTEKELESKIEEIEDNMESHVSNLLNATEAIKNDLNHYESQTEGLERNIEK